MTNSSLVTFDVDAQAKAAEPLAKGSAQVLLAATSLQVTDDDSFRAGLSLRTQCGEAVKRITAFWKPLADLANQTHKAITGKRGEMCKPFEQAQEIVEKKCNQFYLAQQRAKKQAEEQLARAAHAQQEALKREADELFAQGEAKAARNKLAQAEMTVPPALPEAIPSSADTKTRPTWQYEVVHLELLIAAVASGKLPLMHTTKKGEEEPILIVNDRVLKAAVDRQGDSLRWPGISVKPDVKFSAKRLG